MIVFLHAECQLGVGGYRMKYDIKQRPNASIPEDFVDIAKRYPEAIFQWAHIGGGGDWEYMCKALQNSPNVYVDTKIIHNGDANTYIQFADTNDKIILATNGSDALTIDASQAATFTGNVIVQGTSAAGYVKLSGDGNGAIYTSNGDMQFFTNNAAYTTKFYSANKGSTLLTILDNGNSTFAGDA